MDTTTAKPTQTFGHLVDIHGLLEAIFGDKANQPSKRWIQYQMARKTIPYFRIAGLTRFDPLMVRQALEKNCLITARGVK